MSKKPLLEENVARRWAKYAGIQKDAENFLSEAYNMPTMEEEVVEEDAPLEEKSLEEADVLAELEGLLEQDIDADEEMEMDADDEDIEADIDIEDEGDEDDEEMEMEDEVEMDAEVSMSQEDVEAALKAGLEAMASAIGDALKIKIDVRSGGEEDGEDVEMDVEDVEMDVEDVGMDVEEEVMEEGDDGESKGDKGKDEKDPDAKDYQKESIDRDALVEKVMKRVAARLVKEAKK